FKIRLCVTYPGVDAFVTLFWTTPIACSRTSRLLDAVPNAAKRVDMQYGYPCVSTTPASRQSDIFPPAVYSVEGGTAEDMHPYINEAALSNNRCTLPTRLRTASSKVVRLSSA